MAAQADPSGRPALAGQRWSACSPDAVAAALEVAPGTRLSSQRAAELLKWSTGVLLVVLTLPRLIRPGHPP
jgi:hypothetical protein